MRSAEESTRVEQLGPFDALRNFFFNRVKWRTPISRFEFEKYNALLAKNSEFYRGLSSDMKAKALHRTMAFINNKHFVGHGLEITMEMKLTVAFAAVKLTFGFQNYDIPILHTINIATGAFYSPMLRAHAKGLTSENGTMYLAWDSVVRGIEDESDGLHLAVHEMAHALKIDTVKGSPDKDRFAFYLNTWLKEAEARKTKSDNNFIRAYGKTNMHEFFAVCMENFVERPSTFYKEEPLLFAHTCYLLNQFPLEPKSRMLTPKAVDGLVRQTGAKFPKASAKDYTHHSWHWSLTLLFISVIVTPILIGALTLEAKLPIDGWLYYFLFCTIAAALFYRPVVGYKALGLDKFIIFVLAGGGPLLYSGALVLDAALPIYSWEESAEVKRAAANLHQNTTQVELKDSPLNNWDQTTTFPIQYMQDFRKYPHAEVHATFGRGIMGITRLKRSWIQFEEVETRE